MKPRTVIILSVVLLALVGLVLVRYAGLFGPGNGEDVVFDRTFEDVNAVEIVEGPDDMVALARDDAGWRLVQPVQAEADAIAVNRLLSTLGNLKVIKAFSADDPPGDALTGLDAPRWTVRVTDNDGPHTLRIGRRAAVLGGGEQTYVRRDRADGTPGPVFAVEDDLDVLLERPASRFRNRMLLAVRIDRVKALTVEGEQSFTLTQTDDAWRVRTLQFDAPVNDDAVRRTLPAFTNIAAEDFVDDAGEDLSRYGLGGGRQRLSVTLTLRDPDETRTLLLGAETGPNVFAKLTESDHVVVVSKALLQRLQPDPMGLRDRRVMTLATDRIFQIQLQGPGGQADLLHQDEAWRMLAPLDHAANAAAVADFLRHLGDLHVKTFHDPPAAPAAFGLDKPYAEITLFLRDADEPHRIRFGRRQDDPDLVFIQRGEQATLLEVAAVDAAFVKQSVARLCGTDLTAVPEGVRIDQVILRRQRNGQEDLVTLDRKDDGDWRMTHPTDQEANNERVERIVQQLRNLNAEQIVAIDAEPPRRYSRCTDSVIVTMTPQGHLAPDAPAAGSGVVLRVVRRQINDESPEVFAWVPGARPVRVGRCSLALYDDLTANLQSLTIWQIDPNAIGRISIQEGAAEAMTLTRTEGRWQMEGNELAAVDDRAVAKYLQGLRTVEAERFVPDSAGQERAFGLDKPWLTVTLGAGEETHRLRVALRGPDEHDRRYATTDAHDAVFVLPANEIPKLTRSAEDVLMD